MSLSQVPARWAQTVCDQNYKCASPADITYSMNATKADCVQADTQIWMLLAGSVQDGQAKGRVTYDAAQMGACLAALAGETCEQWTNGLTHDVACPEAFTAKVAVGGACQSDVECIGGYCDGADLSADPPKEGACKARVAHGAACMADDKCVASDYCDGTAKMCVAKKAGGSACDFDDECGNACNSDTMKCSGYAGCNVGGVTPRDTLLSLLVLGLAMGAVRIKRR